MEFDFEEMSLRKEQDKEIFLISNITLRCSAREFSWLIEQFDERDDNKLIFETEVFLEDE